MPSPNCAEPAKSGDLAPDDVTAGSGKKAWWKCPKGSDHKWEAVIANRAKGVGCPGTCGRIVIRPRVHRPAPPC
ncbi:MAG TPA: hypothetical protein DCY79_06730 [Planctomycetaceae bacterium]|nr:hypothetical protein [Planctomycetaceae bacterium]